MVEKKNLEHDFFLNLALEQAQKGRGFCAPNPSVGCVAVCDGEVIASDFHRGAGTAHAEVLVLNQIPASSQPLTLYISLEPCNHWGRTPPCVNAIIEHHVERVVYGYRDPNPKVRLASSDEILRSHGIEVIYQFSQEIHDFYQSYQYWVQTKRPFVTVKWAQSLDGKIGYRGERVVLSNEACYAFTHQQRLKSDVILSTKNTIQCDNPLLNARIEEQHYPKNLAILDSRLELTGDEHCFQQANQIYIFHYEGLQPRFQLPHVTYYPLPYKDFSGYLNLNHVLVILGDIGYHDVWVEGGGGLISSLHKENLVNRSYIYLVPRILGEKGIPVLECDLNPYKLLQWNAMNDNMRLTIDW